MLMKKISLVSALVALLVMLWSPLAFAQNVNNIPAQILYWGQKTSATNYPVGTCKNNNGGWWQQLADGTWAPPEDKLNTCLTGGVMAGYTGNPLFDPWSRQGLYPNQGASAFVNPVGYYTWGTNYPGGYTDTNDWFRNCVLIESLFPRPECQAYPRAGYFWDSYPTYQPWGSYGNQEGVQASYTTGPYGSSTHISANGSLAEIAGGILLGYGLNQLFK